MYIYIYIYIYIYVKIYNRKGRRLHETDAKDTEEFWDIGM